MSDSVMFSGNGEVDACVGEASGIGKEEVCVGDASVVAYGKGEEDACKGEASVVVSGKSMFEVQRTAEYPCVKRLRERRLLSFLWDQGYLGAFEALNHETKRDLLSVRQMQRLVKQGRWDDALVYLNAYLPPLSSENHKRSRRAQIFHNFLLMHYRFANAVAGDKEKHLDKQYADGRWCSSPAELRFRSVTYPILASEPHQLMASYDWDKVRRHASFLVYILANTTPELRSSMPLPSSDMMPHHVLPIAGSGLHRRRHHRVVKKQRPRKRYTDAIFMALKSQHHSSLHENSRAESPNDALEMLVDLLDQTLQAGLRSGCNLSYAKEVAPFFRTISGTSKVHSQNPGISSLTNAGCHTENPSKGLTTIEGDVYEKMKKQRTTGTRLVKRAWHRRLETVRPPRHW
uniref:Uncharacterized protein n=1 Tax=Avena sativa TaxID=4498 RepID=A0ACD5YB70_AVESA